jgi:hypothetical protein
MKNYIVPIPNIPIWEFMVANVMLRLARKTFINLRHGIHDVFLSTIVMVKRLLSL